MGIEAVSQSSGGQTNGSKRDIKTFDSFLHYFNQEKKVVPVSFVQVEGGAYKVASETTPNDSKTDDPQNNEPAQEKELSVSKLGMAEVQRFTLSPLFHIHDGLMAKASNNLNILIADITKALDTMRIEKIAQKYIFDISSLPLRIEFEQIGSKTIIKIQVNDGELYSDLKAQRFALIDTLKKDIDMFQFDLMVEEQGHDTQQSDHQDENQQQSDPSQFEHEEHEVNEE